MRRRVHSSPPRCACMCVSLPIKQADKLKHNTNSAVRQLVCDKLNKLEMSAFPLHLFAALFVSRFASPGKLFFDSVHHGR